MGLYNLGVKDLAKKLEQYRKDHDLTKAQMAELFGVEWQTYYSWIKRNSVSKGHIDTAKVILRIKSDPSQVKAELIDAFSQLPEDKAQILLTLAESFLAPNKGD